MIEEIESRLNWLYAVDGTEKERAAVLAIYDLCHHLLRRITR